MWFSKWELIGVAVIFLIFLVLAHIQTIYPYKDFFRFLESLFPFTGSVFLGKNDSHYQNLIAIHAGIGAVLIGLAFFVAQEIGKEREKGNSYKSFAFLKRSKFFTLLVAEILFFFQFLWGSVNALSVVPVVLIGFFTVISLYRTIDLMLNDFDLKREEEKLFFADIRGKFLKLLHFEITKMLGNNLILKKINELNFVEFSPFSPLSKKDYIEIKSDINGVLTNLDFKKLEQFVLFLQSIAPETEKSFTDKSAMQNTTGDSEIENPYCYVTPRFFSQLKASESALLWVRRDLIKDEDMQKKLGKMAQEIFTLSSSEFDLDEARNYLKKIKLLCLDMIRTQKIDELRKVTEFYILLIEDFYSYLKPYGGGFSEKQASDMRMDIFFGGFRTIQWLTDDIREIFETAVESKNKSIIAEAAFLPMRMMYYAIDYKDHLVFEQFQYYPVRLYHYSIIAKQKGDNELANFMADRAWRYPKELSDYHLEPKLKEDNYPNDEFEKFAISILKIFQNLLKASFENLDIENFSKFLSSVAGIFRQLTMTGRFEDKMSQKIFDNLNNKRQQMLFGLASWILFQLELDKENQKLAACFNEIKNRLPNDITKLTKIFLDAHSFDVENFWGWGNWELEGKESDGFAHSINILEKLEKFYAVHALILLRHKTDEEIASIKLPHTRDFAFLAEGTRDLIKVINDIKDNPGSWKFVLPEDAAKKANKLKELLDKAKIAQDEEDLKKKRDIGISKAKIEKFKEGIVSSFYETPTIREILKQHNRFQDKSNESYKGSIKKLGINTMFDKALFFDDSVAWHVHFIGDDNGFGFGRGMATGENDSILDKIKGKAERIKPEDFDLKLGLNEDPSTILIFAVNNASWQFFEDERKSKKYIPKWQTKGLAGIYKFVDQEIPVYEIYDGKNEPAVFILNTKKLGELIQYSPLDEKDSQDLRKDIFYINVREFLIDSALMAEFISNPPKWLKAIKEIDKQKEYLQERVLINIFERFEFRPSEDFEGYFFSI